MDRLRSLQKKSPKKQGEPTASTMTAAASRYSSLEAVTQFPSEERRKEISVQSPEEDALLTMKNLELTSDFYQNILGRIPGTEKEAGSPPCCCPSPLIRPALTAENTWPLHRGEKLTRQEREQPWIWWLMNWPTVSCSPRERSQKCHRLPLRRHGLRKCHLGRVCGCSGKPDGSLL